MATPTVEGDRVANAKLEDTGSAEHQEMPEKIQYDGSQQMRSKIDDLTVWESVKKHRLITLVAMAAAFSAALDGYRKFLLPQGHRKSTANPFFLPRRNHSQRRYCF